MTIYSKLKEVAEVLAEVVEVEVDKAMEVGLDEATELELDKANKVVEARVKVVLTTSHRTEVIV